jgi:hypothetical protein
MIKWFAGLLLLACYLVTNISDAAVHHERYPQLPAGAAGTTVILIHGWSCDSS